jgi:hypothetical protein
MGEDQVKRCKQDVGGSRPALIATGLSILLLAAATRGEVTTVVEHIDNAHATADVQFKTVPAPSKTDAATKAKFTIVAGHRDANSGDVEKLNDGRMPSNSDEPAENFFFDEGTDGGRILIDLAAPIAINQVNTYSWHPDTRGPQVYSLYAAMGSEAGFNSGPDNGTNPEKAGWKKIASVDTRPKKAERATTGSAGGGGDIDAMGGQYAVSIRDTAGPIGTYRYLLLVISRTEADDDWGNTFYSEIDVIVKTAAVNQK